MALQKSSPVVTDSVSNSLQLGQLIYTDYLVAFELVAFVLLVAMVAAIVLVFRGAKEGTRTQRVREQVSATKAGRLKVVKV